MQTEWSGDDFAFLNKPAIVLEGPAAEKDAYNMIQSIAISSNDNMIAAGGCDGHVWLWQKDAFKSWSKNTGVKILKGQSDSIECMVFAGKDDKFLLTGASNGIIERWRLGMEDPYVTLFGRHELRVTGLVVFPGAGSDILTSARFKFQDQTIGFWSIEELALLPVPVMIDSECHCIAISSVNDHIATGHGNYMGGTLVIWDITAFKSLSLHEAAKKINRIKSIEYCQGVRGVCYSRDGGRLAIILGDIIVVLACDNYREDHTLKTFNIMSTISFVGGNSSLLVVLPEDSPVPVALYDADTGSKWSLKSESGDSSFAIQVAVSSSGKYICSAAYKSHGNDFSRVKLLVFESHDEEDDTEALFGDIKHAAMTK